jgi:hypothetical protein
VLVKAERRADMAQRTAVGRWLLVVVVALAAGIALGYASSTALPAIRRSTPKPSLKAQPETSSAALPISAGLVLPAGSPPERFSGLEPAETKYNLQTLLDRASKKQSAILGYISYYDGDSLVCWADLDYFVPFAALDPKTGKQVAPGSYHVGYGCQLGIFNKAGTMLDAVGVFDRVQKVYYGDWSDQSHDQTVVVETFLDGVYIYSTNADGRLAEVFNGKSGRQSVPVLFRDVDGDMSSEAVLVVGDYMSASTVIGQNTYYLGFGSKLPDGRSCNELTKGIIAVDIMEDTRTPFTYYPDWSLGDLQH